MSRTYNNNGTLQFRNARGRFTRAHIECEVCPHCRSFIPAETDYSTGIARQAYPEKCHNCQKPLKVTGETQ